MPGEAGVVALDLVECLIALNRNDEARILVETVIGEFQRANLNDRAMTALDYLRELLPKRASREAVRHVRGYVEKLRSEPGRVFLPLED